MQPTKSFYRFFARCLLKFSIMRLITLLLTLGLAQLLHAQCEMFPILYLGNDTLLCPGQTITYQLPSGYQYHSWGNGSNSSQFTVSQTDTVILTVSNETPNLVVNGDFESGNVGFTSSYIYGTGGAWGLLSNPGQYAIATSPNLTHTNFSNCVDHTATGPGNMLVANGSSTPNTAVWCQSVNVSNNTDFVFSAWIGNALNDPNVSNLQFTINGVQLGPIFSTTPVACTWNQFYQTWNSGLNNTAQLCIVNQNTTGGGNDFIIDDIYFGAVCNQVDSVIVLFDTSYVSAGPDLQFCANETESFTASSNYPFPVYTWEGTTSGENFTPTASGYYSVTGISPFGCPLIDSALATITPMPWDIDQVVAQPTACGSNSGAVYVTTTGTFNDPPVYTWNGPGASNPNQINASVWTNLGTGWYYLTIESDGCFRYDSAQVTPTNPPVADFNADIISGCSPLTVNFTNTSQNIGTCNWNFGNGQTASVNDLSSQQQQYTASATVQLIVTQGNCADTAALVISVDICGCTDPLALNYNPAATVSDGSCTYPIPPNPVIETYNIFTPDGNGDNDLFFVSATNVIDIELTILNRWGTAVFSGKSASPEWNGEIDGLPAAEGTYFYMYKINALNGEIIEGHGFVELVRK